MSEATPEPVQSRFNASRLMRIALTLAVGAAGGLLFKALTMPLPWMLGSMLATMAASLIGLPLEGSKRMRLVVVTVLGVMLGSAFKPDVMSQATQWGGSITGLLLWVAVITSSIFFSFRILAGFSKPTSFFSAAPGGFGEMVLMGTAMGGDERTISLIHTMRLMWTVFLIALWFRIFQGYMPGNNAVMGTVSTMDPIEGAMMLGSAAVGFLGARALKIPAGELLGPLVVSAIMTISGFAHAAPPSEIVSLAQLVLGTTIGCRFVGISIRSVLKTLAIGSAATVAMLSTAVAAAEGMAYLTGLPFEVLLLAFAPGGLAEMCLISLSLHIDIAFVSTHHSIRLMFLILCLPLVFKVLKFQR